MIPAALILAGSRSGIDPVAAAEGVAHKALAIAGGRPLLARVIDAVRAAGVARIAVCADAPEVIALAEAMGAEVLPPAAGPSASVAAGFSAMGAPLLVTTADHALLRPEWITCFIADAPTGCDLAVLLARREDIERAMPGGRRTWLRFADGDRSGCNLFLLRSPAAQSAIRVWQELEANRKKPWRIAARLGPGMLISYITGRLSLAQAFERIGAKLGVRAAAVTAVDGLAAVDVDKPGDLADVRRLLDQG